MGIINWTSRLVHRNARKGCCLFRHRRFPRRLACRSFPLHTTKNTQARAPTQLAWSTHLWCRGSDLSLAPIPAKAGQRWVPSKYYSTTERPISSSMGIPKPPQYYPRCSSLGSPPNHWVRTIELHNLSCERVHYVCNYQ